MVTIVIPAYNAAGCIDECIKSVCNQTFSSWRLLVVNDGSTDDINEVKSFIKKNTKSYIVTHP